MTSDKQTLGSEGQLSVVLLTFDEEPNLSLALESIRPLHPEIFIVDSGSGDRTCEIAVAAGCQVFHHRFENHAAQLNWALNNLPISGSWVMRLDADERLTPELVKELSDVLKVLPHDVTGLEINRRVYFWGRWIRHGGRYPQWLLRIWRTGSAHCEDRWMDEHMVLRSGRAMRLKHDFIDENHKNLTFWIDKHNRYADREVKDLLLAAFGRNDERLRGQIARIRWAKKNVYLRCPLFWRAFVYWLYRYVIRLGFLDGRPGLVFHFLQGCWYRLLIDAKLYEMRSLRLPEATAGSAEEAPSSKKVNLLETPLLRDRD
jgi:glycosyltransferase involved in cell wall biosynthesis